MQTKWHFFSDSEVVGLKDEFVAMLDRARGIAEVPFNISSGYRNPDQNKTVGGVEDSSHTLGLAVDLSCTDSIPRFKMVSALLEVGFKRIGIYNCHIHVDLDPLKQQEVMWWGVSH